MVDKDNAESLKQETSDHAQKANLPRRMHDYCGPNEMAANDPQQSRSA
jgi:hypothetical protein